MESLWLRPPGDRAEPGDRLLVSGQQDIAWVLPLQSALGARGGGRLGAGLLTEVCASGAYGRPAPSTMHGGRSPFSLLPAWATLNGVEEHSGINPALVLFLAVFVVAAGMALFLRFSDKNKKQ